MTGRVPRFSRRAALLGAGAAIGAGAWYSAGPHRPDLTGTLPLPSGSGEGYLDDASGLSRTPVASHTIIETPDQSALIDALRRELKAARDSGQPAGVGAARHSMGGHAIPRDGRALSLSHDGLEPDTAAGTYRVAAGARWSQVIARLDAAGFSPKVMQSNNDFGVASTFSVNAHGWPAPFGPAGSTVRRIAMMLPDGELVACSRDENADLFRLAMGGYGLFGIITELELEMVPNAVLESAFLHVPGDEFGPAMANALARDPSIQMAYGRLNVARDGFLSEALLIAYTPAADQSDIPAAHGSGFLSRAARPLFRAQRGNEAAKRLRWRLESGLGPLATGPATRNSLLNEPVATLDDRDPRHTDILHEYFVAPERFADFLAACRAIIPESYQELLNVTLRYVLADRESVLSFAPEPRIAAVMLFSQEMTARAEADMARMTGELIEAVIGLGGTYYLPYRPHASVDQFTRAYPRAAEAAAAKRAHDPGLLFRNGFWDNYLGKL